LTKRSQITRVQIADHIASAFGSGSVHRTELIKHAEASKAKPEVLTALRRLPDHGFTTMRDLWIHLEDIPVEVTS
jgi:hypothetical protein